MKRLIALFITIVLIVLFQISCYGLEMNNKKVVILLINRLALDDIENMVHTRSVIKKEAIGLMNTRGNKYNNEYSSLATIGSGSRTDARHSTSRFINSDIDGINIYQRRTGFKYNGEDIINLSISNLINLNKTNNYNPSIGLLGDISNEFDLKTAVLGNSDIEDYNVRLGSLIVMDRYGLVDLGDIGENTIEVNPYYPYGIKTNYDYLNNKFDELYIKADITIVELGDLYRLESYKENLLDSRFESLRKQILTDIDEFINGIYNRIDLDKTKLIIINPYPSIIGYEKGERLTPLVVVDKDKPSGIVSSATTRRKGIISNIDITSEIMSFFEINSFNNGNPFDIIDETNNLEYIREVNKRTSFIYNNRLKVLYTFAIYEIIVSIISFLCIQIYNKYCLNTRLIDFLVLTNLAIPFVILILPIFCLEGLFSCILTIIILTIIVTLGTIKLSKKSIDSLIILSGLITFGLTIDLIFGSKLIKSSFLGYDPIIGARFYGIGNEYMGILVGATIIFVTCLLEEYKINKNLLALFMIIVIFVIGAPNLGANVGGTITAVISFTFVIFKLSYKDLKIRHYIFILFSVILILSIFSFADLFLIENKSHFANAIIEIGNKGVVSLLSIIKRKLTMNFKLFGVTIWSKVLLLSLIFFGILFYRPFGITQKISKEYPKLFSGLFGILVASIIGFLVNDSGVVASGTAIIFLIMTFMYIILKEFEKKGNERT